MQDDLLPISPDDIDAMLALNNLHARELVWTERERFDELVGMAFLALRPADDQAFLIAFDQDADYDSENFCWFRARYPRFAYVDRIAVAEAARGRGLARKLYERLFEEARRAGHDIVAAEVNTDPPNPASHAFHAAMGFEEVGEAAIYGGKRSVRYYLRRL